MLHPIDDMSFESEVLSSAVPVLLDVSTRWCGPCRALVPVLQQLGTRRGGSVKIVSLDADEFPALAGRLGVKAFPTVIAFRGGEEIARRVGLTTLERLSQLLD